MRHNVFIRMVGLYLVFATTAIVARAGTPFNPADSAFLAQGRYVYQRNCVPCHGVRGDGRGELGITVIPLPRDFTSGIFKYRSTPSGALPTDEDLERTIARGIAGTAMPVFNGTLSAREIHAVVQYVKEFSPKWNRRENFAKTVLLPAMPVWLTDQKKLSAGATKGRELFAVTCAGCHGEDGSGTAKLPLPELLDAWGKVIQPADLRSPALHSGRELTDVYRVLVTGLNGTPMPSFLEATTEEQRWELVAFIAELRKSRPSGATGSPTVSVR